MWKKFPEIVGFIYCEINDIERSFYLVLLEAYPEPSQTSQTKRFTKVVNG